MSVADVDGVEVEISNYAISGSDWCPQICCTNCGWLGVATHSSEPVDHDGVILGLLGGLARHRGDEAYSECADMRRIRLSHYEP